MRRLLLIMLVGLALVGAAVMVPQASASTTLPPRPPGRPPVPLDAEEDEDEGPLRLYDDFAQLIVFLDTDYYAMAFYRYNDAKTGGLFSYWLDYDIWAYAEPDDVVLDYIDAKAKTHLVVTALDGTPTGRRIRAEPGVWFSVEVYAANGTRLVNDVLFAPYPVFDEEAEE